MTPVCLWIEVTVKGVEPVYKMDEHTTEHNYYTIEIILNPLLPALPNTSLCVKNLHSCSSWLHRVEQKYKGG